MTEKLNHNSPTGREIYSVSRLNREVRAVLEGSFTTIWLQGEISNLARPASGHIYFSLKDESSQVRCAMFRNRNLALAFTPDNGLLVLVQANVSLYEDRGEFQLIIESMEPAGDGALQQAFAALKLRLEAEGLFNPEHKKTIPVFSKTVGVITSPTGAAIRDIVSILQRRFPLTKVIIYPAAVQGEQAEKQIINMLEIAQDRNECDVLILARGGGSLEDLWVFNSENVARKIYQCKLPIISGIGHEIDFTIADFVADVRAATPSAAAEMVSPDQKQISRQLTIYFEKMIQIIKQSIRQNNQYVLHLGKRIPHPTYQLQTYYQRVDHLQQQISHACMLNINSRKINLNELSTILNNNNPVQIINIYAERLVYMQKHLRQVILNKFRQLNNYLVTLGRTLDAVSPLASLERGYAVVNKLENNELVRDVRQLNVGSKISTRLFKGKIYSTVDEIIDENKK